MKLFGRSKEAERSSTSGKGGGGGGDADRAAALQMLMSGPGNEDLLKQMGVDIKKDQQSQQKAPQGGSGMPKYEPLDAASQQRVLAELGINNDPIIPGKGGRQSLPSGPSANGGDMGKGKGDLAKGAGKGFGKMGMNPQDIDTAASAIVQALLAQASGGVPGNALPPGQPLLQSQLQNGGGGGDGGGKGRLSSPRLSLPTPQQGAASADPMEMLNKLFQSMKGGGGGGGLDLSALLGGHDPSVPKFKVRRGPLKLQGSRKALAHIKRDCKSEPFVDEDFPPVFNEHVKRWCRPPDIQASDFKPVKPGSPWYLFRGKTSTADVRQGMLGDCWLLSALAALSEYKGGRFVKEVFPGQTALCPEGVYLVRLCLAGVWQEILVDDRIPCVGGDPPYATHPAYAHTVQRQLWASLLEKAFAKSCGSYDALSGGEASEALTVFTGWPCTVIQPPGKGVHVRGGGDQDADVEAMWTELVAAKKAGFMLTCTTGRETHEMESSGLESQHVYALTDVCQVKDKTGKEVRLLKIRNPQGEGADKEWNGDWSRGSSKWTPKLREALGYSKDRSEGVFFLSLDDFQRFYDHCTICRIRGSVWSEHRVSLQLPKEMMPLKGFAVEVTEAVECALVLHQPEKRMRYGPFYKGDFEPLACIGFAVLSADGPGVTSAGIPTAVAVARMRHRPWVTSECTLEPGRYFIVPLSLTKGNHREVTCCCRSSGQVSLKATKLEPAVARVAWASYAKHEDISERAGELKRTTAQDGCELFLAQGDGSCVVALAENRGTSYLKVDLGIMSGNMRYSRGTPATTDYVMPGTAQIVQVALPAKEETQVGWMGTPILATTVIIPPPPLHSPELDQKAGDQGLHAPFRIVESDGEAEWAAKQENIQRTIQMIKEADAAKAKADAARAEAQATDAPRSKPKEKSAARGLFDSMVAEQLQRRDGPATPGVTIEEVDVLSSEDPPPVSPAKAIRPPVRFFPVAMLAPPRPTCIVSL